MAATIGEIMNRELFHVREADDAASVRAGILGMGVTAAPVLDAAGRPVGVVSLRDLALAPEGDRASARMTSPPVVVRAGAAIADAARVLGETGLRHLVVVDDDGVALGMVSAVDVLRGMLGLPARHPAAFPHLDARTGLTWTDDARLQEAWVEVAPDGPGLLVLVHDAPLRPARVVWVEWTHNVRTRVLDVLSAPQPHPELTRWLERAEELFFRAASLPDPGGGHAAVEELRPQRLPPPSAHVLV
jgi:hypothetical protein